MKIACIGGGVVVNALLEDRAKVEIEAIAVIPYNNQRIKWLLLQIINNHLIKSLTHKVISTVWITLNDIRKITYTIFMTLLEMKRF